MVKFFYLLFARISVSLVREIRSTLACRALDRPVVRTKASESVKMTDKLDVQKCFEFAKRLTLKAGEIMKRGFEGEKEVSEKTNVWDVVTNYDRELEELFTTAIKKEYPDHVVIGEEAMDRKDLPELTDKPTWLIDPIDGTLNFMHTFPHTCISVGLVVCKEIVLGIVYNPMTPELYTAVKGGGAFMNGKPIHASKVTELRKAMINLDSFPMRCNRKGHDFYAGRYEAVVQVAHGVRSLGCAALSLAYVARGAFDCFHLDPLKPWDVAAGVLIAREAGATVINTKGGEYNIMKPRTIAAGTEELARELSEMIIEADKKTEKTLLHIF